jgi:hypothetical protein
VGGDEGQWDSREGEREREGFRSGGGGRDSGVKGGGRARGKGVVGRGGGMKREGGLAFGAARKYVLAQVDLRYRDS